MDSNNILIIKEELRLILLSTNPIFGKYFRQNNPNLIKNKQDSSPVTLCDIECENYLRDKIKERFPLHDIIGEEIKNSPANSQTTSEYKWFIDPIDGTCSFITGKPIFTTLIALIKDNRPVLGIIYQPINNEMWVGHYLETEKKYYTEFFHNKHTYNPATSKTVDLNQSTLCTTSPHLFNAQKYQFFTKIATKTKYQKYKGAFYGGDAYNYAMLSLGFIDIIIESGLKTYDFIPLIPIILGAGGVITNFEGNSLTTLNIDYFDIKKDYDLIASANQILHKKILKEI